MNGTATRRSLSQAAIRRTVPSEFVSQEAIFPPAQSRGRSRGRSLVHGLPVQFAYAAIDALLVCLIGATVLWLRFDRTFPLALGSGFFSQAAARPYKGFFLLYAALVVMGCAGQNLYRTPRDRSVFDENLMVAKAVGVATMILIVFAFTSGYKDISRLVVLSVAVLNQIALSGWRYFKRRIVLRRVKSGIGVSRVLIVGAGRLGTALGEWLRSNRQLGYSVCGYLDVKPSSGSQMLGTVNDLRRVALTEFADEIFITLPSETELVKRLALEAHELRLGMKIFPDLYDGLGWRAPLHMIGGFPVMDLHWQPIPSVGLAIKRVIDVVVSGLTLVLTAPLLGLLALCIRLDSSGPAFYPADRIGLKGKKFRCYKLRTMVADADCHKEQLRATNERQGPFFKMENDPRVTRIGRWLRKSSLDELPQLWNVLRGEMTLVGPRPHPVDDYKLYSIEHLRRLDVTPGLTGLWQVTSRNDASFETNMALDLEYIENWSVGLDLKIMLRTIPAVLRAEGR
jgi:exopolysaccharide biosynthesis polyprenyl glycosylphosphotransferase